MSCLTIRKNKREGLLESFRYCQPSGDENVILIPNFLDYAYQTEIKGKKERNIVDIEKVMQTMCKGTYYQTKEKKLPQLIRHIRRKNPCSDFSNNLNVCAIAENRVILPIRSRTMIEFSPQAFFERLRICGFDSVFSPVEEALKTISRTDPDVLQRWFPISDIGAFLEQQINVFSACKPTIVAF